MRVLWGRCTPYGEGRELAPLAEWCGWRSASPTPTTRQRPKSRARRTADAVVARQRRAARSPRRRPTGCSRCSAWSSGRRSARATRPRPAPQPASRDPFVDAVAAVLAALLARRPAGARHRRRAVGRRRPADARWRSSSRELPGPVLLVAGGRSDLLGQPWWDRMPGLEVLPLAPLDDAASERLLRAYLGGAQLDPSTRDVLLGRAQGNPFFLAELLHLLVDRGLLRRVGEGWRLTGELPREILPAGVQAVLAARIDTLDPAAKVVLRDAAVIGVALQHRHVAGAGAARSVRSRSTSAVDELVSRGIVRPLLTLRRDVAGVRLRAHACARRRLHRHREGRASAQARAAGAVVDDVDVGDRRRRRGRRVRRHAGRAGGCARDRDATCRRTTPAWTARGVGVTALVRLGQAALARDDNLRAEAVFTRALELAAGADERDRCCRDRRAGRPGRGSGRPASAHRRRGRPAAEPQRSLRSPSPRGCTRRARRHPPTTRRPRWRDPLVGLRARRGE